MSAKDLWFPPMVNLDVDRVPEPPAPTPRPRIKLITRASPTTVALRAACYRLGIETRETASEREERLALTAHLRLQTKSQLNRARKASRMIDAKRDKQSMMHAGHPARMPAVVARDERTTQLFRAHEKRQAAGWIRG